MAARWAQQLPESSLWALDQVVLPTLVTVGGKEATVEFAGLTPGFVGLYQVNIRIPEGLSGASVPLRIEVGGARSAEVTVPLTQ